MKLFFTGLKHSGKTTFASLIAKHYNIKVEDSDNLILKHINTSIRTFYKESGKEAFMALEAKVIEEFIKENENNDYILSLGGGVSDNTLAMNLMHNTGAIVYLKREEKLILNKIITTSGIPPFLDKDNVEESFHNIFEKRDAIYDKYATICINLIAYDELEKVKMLIVKQLEEGIFSEWK